jgi:hypothetical protein
MLHISRLRAVLQESQDAASDGIGQSAITRFVSFNQCRVNHVERVYTSKSIKTRVWDFWPYLGAISLDQLLT